MKTKNKMVEVKNFRKIYGDFVAVDDISFDVHAGEIFGLLGPNGAGKTSTLESLEGLRDPNGGELFIAGIRPDKEFHRLHSVIGVQLQSSGLPDSITPVEAMRFFCAYHKVEPRIDLLERIGLSKKLSTQYFELSTGQQRRLALALAIAHDPAVLFLDEPTAGLDVGSRVELHHMMREMQEKGTTILLATHDMAEAEEMSNRVGILMNGRMVAQGSPMEITASGAGLTKISVRSERSSLETVNGEIPAVHSSTIKEDYRVYFSTDVSPTVSAILGKLEKNKDPLIDLRVERPSLEDRFLEITNGGQS